jgi:hypothetical protein
MVSEQRRNRLSGETDNLMKRCKTVNNFNGELHNSTLFARGLWIFGPDMNR